MTRVRHPFMALTAAICLVVMAWDAHAQAPDPRVTACIMRGGPPQACAAAIATPRAAPSPAPTAPAAAAAPALGDCAAAETDWKDAERQDTLAAYQRHLVLFPTCASARLARARIAALSGAAAKAEADRVEAERIAAANAEAERAEAARQASANAEAERAEAARQAAAKAEAARAAATKAAEEKAAAERAAAAKPPPPLVASAPPAAAPAPPALGAADLARLLQVHLERVGCDSGSPTGEWNAATIHALEAFNKNAGTNLDVKVASLDALDAVRARAGRVCPLVCGAGQQAEGDRCVRITCAAGLHLDAEGVCRKDQEKAARPRVRAAHAPAAPGHARGARCFNMNGQRFCE